jgi:hypothetical protein
MKKLRLDVESVRVESFDPAAAPRERAGSVDGFEDGPNTRNLNTCYVSCGPSCVSAECGTCAPTCYQTCDDPECA